MPVKRRASVTGVRATPRAGARGGIQVVGRAARLLRVLVDAPPAGLSLGALAAELDLPRSTVQRIASSLLAAGLVTHAPPAGVRLGPGLVRLGIAARAALVADLRPALDALAKRTGETANLVELDGAFAVTIDQVWVGHRITRPLGVGASYPAQCTSAGKAILASMRPDDVATLVRDRLVAMTPQSITTLKALFAELEATRERGYAVTRDELRDGLSSVGDVIHTPWGQPLAIGITAPSDGFHGPQVRALGHAVTRACRAMEASLAARTGA